MSRYIDIIVASLIGVFIGAGISHISDLQDRRDECEAKGGVLITIDGVKSACAKIEILN